MNTLNSSVHNAVDESISSELYNIMLQINSLLPAHEKCIYSFHGNFPNWKEEKDLRDYFENYDSLINVSSYNDTKGKHCNYVNYIYGLYKRHITDCCKCYNNPNVSCDNECPNYFKCDKKYVPNNLLTKFQCQGEKSSKEEKNIFEIAMIDRIVLWITKATHAKAKLSRTSNSDAPSTSETISETISDTTNNESLYDPFYGGMLICFVFLGILFLFFIFYRVNCNCFSRYNYLIYLIKKYLLKKILNFKINVLIIIHSFYFYISLLLSDHGLIKMEKKK